MIRFLVSVNNLNGSCHSVKLYDEDPDDETPDFASARYDPLTENIWCDEDGISIQRIDMMRALAQAVNNVYDKKE